MGILNYRNADCILLPILSTSKFHLFFPQVLDCQVKHLFIQNYIKFQLMLPVMLKVMQFEIFAFYQILKFTDCIYKIKL